MATLDDKLLGEKLQYYCSSSEDEGDGGDSGEEDSADTKDGSTLPPVPGSTDAAGSTNTGPKGVIKDWQRFKQLEAEKRAEQSLEKLQLAKKLAVSCRSHLDDEKERKLEEEMAELEDDAILREFIQRRMHEMTAAGQQRPQFGDLIALETSDQFLDAVDQEQKDVTVFVHVYDDRTASCRTMNACLATLSRQFPTYKFCKLHASTAKVTSRFSETGLPALIVYKAGSVIGNFVRLEDDLGDDFCAGDVENFLIEHGVLEDRSCAPVCIRTNTRTEETDSD